MDILSKTVNIKNNGSPCTEYIENELNKLGIDPIRWAIVKISKEFFTIDTAYVKITDEV